MVVDARFDDAGAAEHYIWTTTAKEYIHLSLQGHETFPIALPQPLVVASSFGGSSFLVIVVFVDHDTTRGARRIWNRHRLGDGNAIQRWRTRIVPHLVLVSDR
jgi:hypothetical protein